MDSDQNRRRRARTLLAGTLVATGSLAWWAWASTGHGGAVGQDVDYIPESMVSRWAPLLENGTEVVFRRTVKEPPPPDPESSLGLDRQGDIPIQGLGKLTDAQIEQVVEVLSKVALKCDQEARALNTGTKEERLAWLDALRSLAKHDAAAKVVMQGRAWAFSADQRESRFAALKLVPKDWDYLVVGNGARTADGKAIDLVIPINLADHGELASIREQITSLRKEMAIDLMISVNGLPDAERKLKIEGFLAAEQSASEGWRRRSLPPELKVDTITWRLDLR